MEEFKIPKKIPRDPKVIATSVRKFKKFWEDLDEDSKEIVAAGIYILHKPQKDVMLSHHIAQFSLDETRVELLKRLEDYTQNN